MVTVWGVLWGDYMFDHRTENMKMDGIFKFPNNLTDLGVFFLWKVSFILF